MFLFLVDMYCTFLLFFKNVYLFKTKIKKSIMIKKKLVKKLSLKTQLPNPDGLKKQNYSKI